MACAKACTSAGWNSPATTRDLPRFFCKSPATASSHFCNGWRKRSAAAQAQFRGERASELPNFGHLQRQTMIRARSRDGRRRLNDIEPVHRVAGPAQLAAAVKLLHVADMAWPAGQEIRIQRKNNVCLFRTIHGADIASESELAAFPRAIAPGRLPLVPLRAGDMFEDALDLRG